MKIYRRHNCTAKHRTSRTLAKCMFPRAEWVSGRGEFATLAHCRVLTIELHETIEKAQTALRLIDSTGCGGMCHRHHELVQLVDPSRATPWDK
jgi:hypothetical protein